MDEEKQTLKPTEEKNDIVFFAETNFRNKRVKFGIKKDDRRRHMYLVGKTGMGKSTAMENMIIQDIINGEGVALVDPHGDFAEKILDYVPNSRINDVIYFNPADYNYPISFNLLESTSSEHKHLIASGLIGVFKKLWADSWGPRLEYLLRNAILALLDYPGSTLLGVMRILTDKSYRQKVITKIQDPVVKSFWVEEYSKYPQAFQVEAIAPIQNKVGQFLSTAMIRNVVGQVKSSIDIREIMDEKKILIMNLSKGRVGEDASALLGAMMITKIQLAAMSRIDTAESTRNDFYLYVDEFQNFATESFATILSEARKYRLNLIIGHQYIEQLDEIVRAAVFGNVGTLMCFRIGAADAEFLATEFAPYFVEEDLVNLTKFDTYMKLMIDGVASSPFSATTLPPLGQSVWTGNKDKVIAVSRERYAKPRAVVEDKIIRWSGIGGYEDDDETESTIKPQLPTSAIPKAMPRLDEKTPAFEPIGLEEKKKKRKKKKRSTNSDQAGSTKKDKETYPAQCYECGQPTEISFKPDGIRPIYCQTCFQKIREKMLYSKTSEPKNMELKEVEPNSPGPEISLSEALKKPLQHFEQKNNQAQPSAKPKNLIKDDNNQDEPADDKLTPIEEIVHHSMSLATKQLEVKDESTKKIKPGEVIKF
ncbi:MAG: type IV secretion system DNA-binding domain-containing protein [Candidatus Buchananbacteria bacterium]